MTTDGAAVGPTVVAPVAIVVSRFPKVTETFILRELVELERQGVPLVLFSLLREDPKGAHPEAEPWIRRAVYSPFVDRRILGANLGLFARRPLRWSGTMISALARTLGNWNAFSGTLGIALKSVWAGERARAAGVRHVHAHFATHPAMSALLMSRVAPRGRELPWSLTAHAHDIFVTHAALAWKLRWASYVRCVSQFNARYLEEHAGLPAGKARVIHCGVEAARYERRIVPGRPGIDRTAVALCIASHQPYKGLPHLVEAIRLLRHRGVDVRCDLVGDGPDRPAIEAQVERHGLRGRVSVLGSRTQEEVRDLLATCDVFVLPSVVAPDGQMEGLPVSLMEALACGLPVVATRISGIPELVRDGETGTLVEPEDPAALANAIERTIALPQKAQALADAGRALVRAEFELSTCVAQLADALLVHAARVDEPAEAVELARDTVTALVPGARQVGLEGFHAGRDARVARLLLPAGDGTPPRRVVAKKHLDAPHATSTAPARAQCEERALRLLEARGVSAPRAIALDADTATVVMSPVGGTPLSTLLRALRLGRQEELALAGIAGAGRWLAQLGGAVELLPSERPRADVVARRLVDEMEADAEVCLSQERLRRELVESLRETCRRAWPEALARRVVAPTHGDFWPGNVLVQEDGSVTVIDLEGVRPGFADEDASTFLVHLALLLPPLPWPGLERRREAGQLAFLRGFLPEAPHPGEPAMRAAKLLRLAALTPQLDPSARGARRRLLRMRLERSARMLA